MREDLPALSPAGRTEPDDPARPDLAAARRRLVVDGLGIIASTAGFGFVYGVTAGANHFSLAEAVAMSVIVFAGAAQFAAIGYVAGGFPWIGVVLLTAFLNARHLLYSAALAPWLADRPRPQRAVMAHVLTDEAFALSLAHFRRLGRADPWGYWFAAIGTTFIPWNLATIAGLLVGSSLPEPERFGLDIVFPAAMAGLALALVSGRREAVAAIVGALAAVAISLASDPAAGVVAGGILGPLAALAMPGRPMSGAGDGTGASDGTPMEVGP